MKKKIFTIMFAILLLTVLSITAFAYNIGDVNGDGGIKAADARLALRYSAKLEEFTDEQVAAADVDASGQVTASDARKILRVAAGLDVPFEGLNIDEYLIEKGVLNVAVPKDNAPFAYEENGELKGIDVTTMKKLADNLNLKLKLHPMTYDECLDAVKNGKCDMATSYNYNGRYDGFAAPKSYYSNDMSVIVLKSSSFESVEQIKGNNSLRIGVLDNTIGKIEIEKIVGESQITAFSTCKEAVAALEKGSIDAFITDDKYAMSTASMNRTVEMLFDTTYYSYNHSVVVAEDNAGLLEKIGQYIKADGVKDYENINDTLKLSVSQNDITIVNGGTACIEIFADSFYTAKPSIYASSPYDDCKTTFVEINNRYYLFISAPSNVVGYEYVNIKCSSEFVNECRIEILMDAYGPQNYQYFDGVNIPDFGVFTGTAPMQTEIDTDNNIIFHTYDASELYNNGITDSSKLEAYLDSIEVAGYTYMGYQELANTISLIYVDEKTEKVITYVEAYDEEGYIVAIAVGYMLPDYMF